MTDHSALRAAAEKATLALHDAINEPVRRWPVEPMQVTDYRHSIWPIFTAAHAAEKAERASLLDTIATLTAERDERYEQLRAVEVSNEHLRLALDFYADPISYAVTQMAEPRSAVHGDGGKRARSALHPKTEGASDGNG